MRSFRPLLLTVFALLLVPAPALALTAPAGTGFYTPPKKLKGKHGDLIWSRPAPSMTLAHAASTRTVLYQSTSLKNKPIAVSGTVWIPRGTAPRGGWPVVSWAHGTTGAADSCAPSKGPESHAYISAVLDAWLAAGYAVAASDYEGLGTPGLHPYLIGPSAGRSVVDIVSAARQLNRSVGKRWIAAGHSQGGHAALFAGQVAPRWAPGLQLKGVAAFAPANNLRTTVSLAKQITTPSSLSGLGVLIVRSITLAEPQLKLSDLLAPGPLALMGHLETDCSAALGGAQLFGQFSPFGLLASWTSSQAQLALRTLDGTLMNPLGTIRAPVLLLQGQADGTVLPMTTALLAQKFPKFGVSVQLREYPGVGHGDIVTAGASDADSWIAARLAG